ncbi:hypothetical protein OS493_015145 [Desmophyllum pertusum]|uniref:Nucleoplasmin-like protein ANO39 n=1 Tax=Desmophyllum pertusum TaxID=174260 RepID=A0A9W9ZPT8_9CNID|nr:hypothetical protein OS493_015145 [Desmophyllum pertusum]
MASMEKEFFWGCELSKDKKEYSWDSEDEELSKADIEQKLVVTQVEKTDQCRLGLGFPSSVVFKLIEGERTFEKLYLLDDEEESDDDDDEDGELVKNRGQGNYEEDEEESDDEDDDDDADNQKSLLKNPQKWKLMLNRNQKSSQLKLRRQL